MITTINKYKRFLESNTLQQSAAVILIKDNKALILQRGDTAPWEPGKWNLPGGTKDNNESIIDCAIRECEEETGLTPSNLKLISTEYKDNWSVNFYVSNVFTGELSLCHESKDYAWVNITELDTFDFVPFVKEAILKVL